jgi:hypothetical protein
MADVGQHLRVLEQRRIGAAFAMGVHETTATPGAGQAGATLSRAVTGQARQAGAGMAAESSTGSGNALFPLPQPPWTRGEALKIETPRVDETRHGSKVTRCRDAGIRRAMGVAEPGAVLSRDRDGASRGAGDGPAPKPTRTRTALGGDSHCDLRRCREGGDSRRDLRRAREGGGGG